MTLEIRANLKQIATAKGKDYRTIKTMMEDFEEVRRTNKYWKRELVGYIDARKKMVVVSEEKYLSLNR